jgi:hypothetical protein
VGWSGTRLRLSSSTHRPDFHRHRCSRIEAREIRFFQGFCRALRPLPHAHQIHAGLHRLPRPVGAAYIRSPRCIPRERLPPKVKPTLPPRSQMDPELHLLPRHRLAQTTCNRVCHRSPHPASRFARSHPPPFGGGIRPRITSASAPPRAPAHRAPARSLRPSWCARSAPCGDRDKGSGFRSPKSSPPSRRSPCAWRHPR